MMFVLVTKRKKTNVLMQNTCSTWEVPQWGLAHITPEPCLHTLGMCWEILKTIRSVIRIQYSVVTKNCHVPLVSIFQLHICSTVDTVHIYPIVWTRSVRQAPIFYGCCSSKNTHLYMFSHICDTSKQYIQNYSTILNLLITTKWSLETCSGL